ncbi:hypothetical protein E1B28_010389 [Marasmius oreades]|uniref:Deoxyribonuclease NucA/NucB domain-containing protein n=1 Tax=Marasmius oreades TaxID=181124 RepID=A0A9P7RX79_9AGAR|nr:uncharacterized protein E1B28_010389 [Marasmius oreades]KAG7091347.1 hypothetical protein E1B28_010389 [Marasmius oreades]
MSTLAQADLRIASKRAGYDNNKPLGESETIVLYIYNAGPALASAPEVKAGFSYSMDYEAVTKTLRAVGGLITPQPSWIIEDGTLDWKDLPPPLSQFKDWDMVTTLPDVPAGMLMELSLSFPMFRQKAYADYPLTASVESKTPDPRKENNTTTYVITPNHHDDGSNYWNTPGDLKNLDSLAVEPMFQVDLRVASARACYNNNLPFKEVETLTFFVFNDGPTTAHKPVLTAGYTTSMDYSNITCSLEEAWIPDGTDPSESLSDTDSPLQWQPLNGIRYHIDGWNVICNLPRIPPTTLYRVKISFPMNRTFTYNDYTATASVSSEAEELNPHNNSTTYVITPTDHSKAGDAYWQAKGNIKQLDGPSVPSGSRACLTGWLPETPVIVNNGRKRKQATLAHLAHLDKDIWQVYGYDLQTKSVLPKKVAGTETRTSSEAITVTFSPDGKNVLTYTAHPDTLVYLSPFSHGIGWNKVSLGYWIPVRMLWAGAMIRGMRSDGRVTPSAYVVNVEDAVGQNFKSVEPKMVSASHSYVVGTLGEGGILTHNPKDGQRCGPANVPAILATISRAANNLVATTTPPPGIPPPRHGYDLRYRRPADPPTPPPARRSAPPVLPMDVPRRDEDGNWLIYLYEEDTPGAVENARHAVESGRPAILTYDPNGTPQRRRESTGQVQSQSELLDLTRRERSGRTGTLGQLDRDEYPPAIAAEGGAGAMVTYIEAGDNRRAGSLMGQQFMAYRQQQPDGQPGLQRGDTFRFVIINENMSELEYLGDSVPLEETQIERPPTD